MSKDSLFDMTNKLKPLIAKKHTKYPCGGSSGLCDLQMAPWLKLVDVQ
jgi:hypothetical protein